MLTPKAFSNILVFFALFITSIDFFKYAPFPLSLPVLSYTTSPKGVLTTLNKSFFSHFSCDTTQVLKGTFFFIYYLPQ